MDSNHGPMVSEETALPTVDHCQILAYTLARGTSSY